MHSPPINIRPGRLRVCVPYVASAQMREQNGSAYFRSAGGIRRPHCWHHAGARSLRVCFRIAICIFPHRVKN